MDHRLPGVQNHKDLDAFEEQTLLKIAKRTNKTDPERQKARDKIVLTHMPLVFKTAKFYSRMFHCDTDLLVSDGVEGLINAIDKYRFLKDNDARFSTYAFYRIRVYIQRAARDTYLIVVSSQYIKMKRDFISAYKIKYKCTPSNDEIRDYLIKVNGIEPHIVNAIIQSRTDVSYDNVSGRNPTRKDRGRATHRYNDNNIKTVAEEMDQDADIESLYQYLNCLRPDIAEIIKARNGLKPYTRQYTLQELGDLLHVSKEAIRLSQNIGYEQIRAHHLAMRHGQWQAKIDNNYLYKAKLISDHLT